MRFPHFGRNKSAASPALVAFYVTIPIVIFIGCISYKTYHHFSERDSIVPYGQALQIGLSEFIEGVRQEMRIVESHIDKDKPIDVKEVAAILKGADRSYIGKARMTTRRCWLSPDGRLRACDKSGVLAHPVQLDRVSIDYAANDDTTTFFSARRLGILSQQPVIPMTQSVRNASGDLVGYVHVGLSLRKLEEKFARILPEKGFVYALVGNDGELLLTNDSWLKDKLGNKVTLEGHTNLSIPRSDSSLFSKERDYHLVLATSQTPYKIYIRNISPEEDMFYWMWMVVATLLTFTILYGVFRFYRKESYSTLSNVAKELELLAAGKPFDEETTSKQHYYHEKIKKVRHVIEQLKKEEAELEEEVRTSTKEKEEALKSNQAKSEFLANMSHELRTPLFTLKGYSEMIAREMYGPIPASYIPVIEHINNASEDLMRLVNDILDLSKIEAGKMELDERHICVRSSLNRCYQYVKQLAFDNKVNIEFDIEEGELPLLYADEMKLRQICLNLLTNAIKFTPEGGTVTLSVKVNNGLVVSVKDTGVGVPKEDIPVILSAFGQSSGNQEYNRKHATGSGLGLPMVCLLVELHGGKFFFDSVLGQGSTVSVTFPKERLNGDVEVAQKDNA